MPGPFPSAWKLGYIQADNSILCPDGNPQTIDRSQSNSYITQYTYGMRAPGSKTNALDYTQAYRPNGGSIHENFINKDFGVSAFPMIGDTLKNNTEPYVQHCIGVGGKEDMHKFHTRHSKRANFWFPDGHVEPVVKAQYEEYGILEAQFVE